MATGSKLTLVEFYHHGSDETEPYGIDSDADSGSETDEGDDTEVDLSDALGEDGGGNGDERDESDETSGADETDSSGSSWLRRLATLGVLAGMGFALTRRREEAEAAVGRAA